MKEKLKGKIQKFKKEFNDFKDKVLKTIKTKIFWCELLIIISICLFAVANFLLNFYLGMYLLSLLLFLIALFSWKYI